MRLHLTSGTWFRVRLTLSITALSALCLACLAEVEGDRAMTGECPAGEVCSDRTPLGLTFVGHAFYDEPTLRLGPIVAGGSFDLGLRSRDTESTVPDFAFEMEDASVLLARRGEGTFGPTEEGEPLYQTDAHLTLMALEAGTSYVRIVDAATGELFDRIALDVVQVDEVRVVLAQDVEREYLYAGCEEMVGIRLYGQQGSEQVRGFDQSFALRTDSGAVSEETRFWDCVIVETPAEGEEMRFEIDIAGGTHERSLPIMSLESDGLDACPVINRD